MTLTVGFNSYVTLDEANSYVEDNYLSEEDNRVKWAERSDADKIVLLKRAARNIELLPFTGRKTGFGQELSFPRYPSTTVPLRVKNAQVEEALALTNAAYVDAVQQASELRARGVFRYRIGELSEQFGRGESVNFISPKAQELLHVYLQGGFDIC